MSLHYQLDKHIKTPDYFIYPTKEWTLEEYQEFFEYFEKGWIIQGDPYDLQWEGKNGFIVEPEWEDEPMWSGNQEDNIDMMKELCDVWCEDHEQKKFAKIVVDGKEQLVKCSGCLEEEEEIKYCWWNGYILTNLDAPPDGIEDIDYVVDNIKEKGWAGEGSITQITYKKI